VSVESGRAGFGVGFGMGICGVAWDVEWDGDGDWMGTGGCKRLGRGSGLVVDDMEWDEM
jgi:hypothetical protein